MAVQLDVEMTGEVVDVDGSEEYHLILSVVNANTIPREIFLHTTRTDRFDGVITSKHLDYPVEPKNGYSYYRKDTAVSRFDNVTSANKAREVYQQAINELVDIYHEGLSEFLTTQVYTGVQMDILYTFFQKEDRLIDVHITNDAGGDYDLSGSEVQFKVDNTPIDKSVTGGGIEITDAAAGELVIDLTSQDLDISPGYYASELRVSDSESAFTVLSGLIHVKRSLFGD